jgi:uncharacterized protein
VRDRLTVALRGALRSRDQAATAALRSALAAIANAEAIDPGSQPARQPARQPPRRSQHSSRPESQHSSRHVAAAVAGLGAAEAPRKVLTEADTAGIVRAEIADRHLAASQYEQGGHRERAERLRAEIEVLEAVLRPG